MAKTIQIRNVPVGLRRKLGARAARLGMSLSTYLVSELKEITEQETLAEFRERLRGWPIRQGHKWR